MKLIPSRKEGILFLLRGRRRKGEKEEFRTGHTEGTEKLRERKRGTRKRRGIFYLFLLLAS
jgi:hypothetical protein